MTHLLEEEEEKNCHRLPSQVTHIKFQFFTINYGQNFNKNRNDLIVK